MEGEVKGGVDGGGKGRVTEDGEREEGRMDEGREGGRERWSCIYSVWRKRLILRGKSAFLHC